MRVQIKLAGTGIATALALTLAACAAVPPQAGTRALPVARMPTISPRIRPLCPIRMGGVYVRGNAAGTNTHEGSLKISTANEEWISANLDLIAVASSSISVDSFARIRKSQRLFTPLLFTYASTLYEGEHNGNVGGWKPTMTSWTLLDASGKEVVHPDSGAHWMDFANHDWAEHWRNQAIGLMRAYNADGVVAAELPIGNSAISASLQKYPTMETRIAATTEWLRTVDAKHQFLFIPSAIGFDLGAGHTTLPTPPGTEELELPGRLWDEYFSLTDGAWAEGWLRPYWADGDVSEEQWEIEVEAADRAARNDQVFIATCGYKNDSELEFALASYLLAIHHQGRLVFQPMPLVEGAPNDAGLSLDVAQREIKAKARFFDVPLGVALQERHTVPVTNGLVWRRSFANGLVYVNSDDKRSVTVDLGGPMERPTGERVRSVALPPHSGAILVYPRAQPAKADSPKPGGPSATHR